MAVKLKTRYLLTAGPGETRAHVRCRAVSHFRPEMFVFISTPGVVSVMSSHLSSLSTNNDKITEKTSLVSNRNISSGAIKSRESQANV